MLGTVQFGMDYGINNQSGKPTDKEVFEILKTATELGIRYLDTAPSYGNSQALIGKYHSAGKIGSFEVMSKFNLLEHGLVASVNKSLEETGKESFHTLYFHSFSDYQENPLIMDQLSDLKSQGLIKNIGISIYSNKELEIVIQNQDIDVIQLPFNLLDNHFQRGKLLSEAKKSGKCIAVRSVFLQGLFFKMKDEISSKLRPLIKYLDQLDSFCENKEIPIQSLCVNYPLSKRYIDYVLLGVETKKQLDGNISSLKLDLSDEIYSEIDQIAVKETELLNPVNW